jgi:hypothetical protein
MGSERTGATPGQPPHLNRQGSIGPAIVSEFNPLDANVEDPNKAALDNPTIKKTEHNAGQQQVLFDNFLNA